MDSGRVGRFSFLFILFTAACLKLSAQTCGNVAVTVSSDSQFLLGSSSADTTFSWALNGQTVASGANPQLALFHFDGGLTDTSGVAPSVSTGTSFAAGKWGSAVAVGTGGMLKYPGTGNLSFAGGTIEMWVSPQSSGSAAVYAAHDNTLFLYVAPNGDQLKLSEAASGVFYGGTVVGGSYNGTGGGSIQGWAAGQWHHVALTYSTTSLWIRIYIDGALVGQNQFSSVPMPAAGGSFTVDGDPWGRNSAFLIDEMRISNVEKTAQEILSDADRSSPFADNEIDLALAGLAAGPIVFQASNSSGASCGSAGSMVAPLTNINPSSGLLPSGSTSTALTFTSPQAESCSYSVGTLLNYTSMQPFDSGGAVTAHSGVISGLSADPRVINSVYIRCSANPSYATTLQYRVVAGPYGSFPRIGSIWSGEYIYSTAPALAQKIQLFLGAAFTPAEANAIRSTNPGVLILPSINATETTPNLPAVPESYYLHNTSGSRIQNWPGDYLLNLTNPAVAQFLAQYAFQVASQSNFVFDGIFFDNFRTSISNVVDMFGNPVAIDVNGDGIADNGSALDAAWSAGVYQELATFRSLLPNGYVAGHLGAIPPAPSSLSAFNGDSLVFSAVDVREGTAAFGSVLDAYQTWFSAGQSPVITMMQSSPQNQIAYGYGYNPQAAIPPATFTFGQTFYPNMRFGLTMALMNNGFSTYDFGDTGANQNWWYDEYNFNLGTPVGPAVQIGGTTPANRLSNASFESGLSNWALNLTAPAIATVASDTAIVADGNASAHVTVIAAGAANWQVSFEQGSVSLTAGTSYQLQFWARSDAPRTIGLHAMGGAPNWTAYGLSSTVAINTSWSRYSVSFVATATAADGRIQFWPGDVTGNVWIDGVQLTPTPSSVYQRDYTNGVVVVNGTSTPQTITLEPGLQRFVGSQAPMYQYIVDDTDAGFSSSGSWSTVSYDTGYSSNGGGGETASGPYYHAWNRTCHQLNVATGTAQWNLNIPADGTYTIQAWLPAAPGAGSWTRSAVYEVVSGGSVVASTTIDQSTAIAGDQWHTIATVNLTAAGAPYVRIHNGGSGSLIADALYVTSAPLFNNGAPAPSVTLAAMDGILLQRQQPIAAPATGLTGIVNTASWQPSISPSSLVSIVGYGFGATQSWSYSPSMGSLPTSLGGVSVNINGKPAYVSWVSPTQVVVIAPDDTTTGSVPVQITVNGTSYSGTTTLQKLAPALLPVRSNGVTYAQATHANGSAITASSPAVPGEIITLLGTGFGPTNPATPSSQSVSIYAPVALPVTATIGGLNATVTGAAKVSPGVYQLTVVVPAGAGTGNQLVQTGASGFLSPAGVFVPLAGN